MFDRFRCEGDLDELTDALLRPVHPVGKAVDLEGGGETDSVIAPGIKTFAGLGDGNGQRFFHTVEVNLSCDLKSRVRQLFPT